MKNLRLIPPLYKQQPVLNVNFAFDPTLIALVISQMRAQWRQTLYAWLFPKKAFQFAKGTAIRFILELLGHNSTKTTERYTHVSNRMLERIESPIDRIIKSNNTDR